MTLTANSINNIDHLQAKNIALQKITVHPGTARKNLRYFPGLIKFKDFQEQQKNPGLFPGCRKPDNQPI